MVVCVCEYLNIYIIEYIMARLKRLVRVVNSFAKRMKVSSVFTILLSISEFQLHSSFIILSDARNDIYILLGIGFSDLITITVVHANQFLKILGNLVSRKVNHAVRVPTLFLSSSFRFYLLERNSHAEPGCPILIEDFFG